MATNPERRPSTRQLIANRTVLSTSASLHGRCVVCSEPLQLRESLTGRTCSRRDCQLAYQQHLSSMAPCCVICGSPLPRTRRSMESPYRTCQSGRCATDLRERLQSSPSTDLTHCLACGILMQRNDPTRLPVCPDRDCRAVAAVRIKQLERSRIVALHRHQREALIPLALERRAEEAAQLYLCDPESYSLIFLPCLMPRLADPDPGRLDCFRKKIAQTVQEVNSDDFSHPYSAVHIPPHSPTDNLQAVFCALCRGWCCSHGGDGGYFRAETMSRIHLIHADLPVNDIVALYLRHVPEKVVDGSCIFHGEHGCGLPRSIRPTVCNSFICDSIHNWLKDRTRNAPARAYAVAEERGLPVRTAFATGDGPVS